MKLRFNSWATSLGVPIVLASAVVLGGCAGTDQGLALERPRVVHPAPPLQGRTVLGAAASLRRLRGAPVLVHFWATWCAPCIVELPALARLARDRIGGVRVLSVCVDRAERRPRVQELVDRLRPGFPVILDPRSRLRRLYEARLLPTTYLLRSDGSIAGRIRGSRDWDSPRVRMELERAISRPQ